MNDLIKTEKKEIVDIDTHRNKELHENLEMFILEGNAFKRAMELAGYAESTIKCKWKEVYKNVNWDKLAPRIKNETALLQLHAIKAAHESIDSTDNKRHDTGMKTAVGMGRIHLEDKTPSSITFNFQTVDKQLVVKQSKEAPKGEGGKGAKNVDKQQLSTDIEDVE